MEDVRMGRKSGSSETNPIVENTSTQVVLSDLRRTSLKIFPPVSGTLTLSSVSPVAAGTGITLIAGNHPLELDIQRDGLACTKSWYAIHSVGGITVTVLESRIDDT